MLEEDPAKKWKRVLPNALHLGLRWYSARRIPYYWQYSEYDEEYGILERTILLGFVAFQYIERAGGSYSV